MVSMDGAFSSPRASIDLGTVVLRRRGSVVRRHRRHSRLASATTDEESDSESLPISEPPATEKPRHKHRRLSASKLRLLGGNIKSLVNSLSNGSPRESSVGLATGTSDDGDMHEGEDITSGKVDEATGIHTSSSYYCPSSYHQSFLQFYFSVSRCDHTAFSLVYTLKCTVGISLYMSMHILRFGG